MSTYVYKCKCGHKLEERGKPLFKFKKCPECHDRMEYDWSEHKGSYQVNGYNPATTPRNSIC